MPDQRQQDLDQQMERDAELRRETAVHDALGPTEGDDGHEAAESALSPEERGGAASRDRPTDRQGAAHVERGAHSDESMDFDVDSGEARTVEDRE